MAGSLKLDGSEFLVKEGGQFKITNSELKLKSSGNTVVDSSGNAVLSESGGNVTLGNVRLPASGGIKDSSGNDVITESGGNSFLGNIRLSSSSALKDSSGNNIIDSNGTLLSSKILSVNWFPTNSVNAYFDTTSYHAFGTENAITPSNSSNRVLMQATVYCSISNNNTNINYNRHYLGFYKGDYTSGQSVSLSSGAVMNGFGAFQQNHLDVSNNGYIATNFGIQWLDSPNSTSEQKYGIATRKHDGNDGRIYIYGFDMVIWELL